MGTTLLLSGVNVSRREECASVLLEDLYVNRGFLSWHCGSDRVNYLTATVEMSVLPPAWDRLARYMQGAQLSSTSR